MASIIIYVFFRSGVDGVVAGKWELDRDGNTLALSFATPGFQRTIVTKGGIQNIYGVHSVAKLYIITRTSIYNNGYKRL